MINGTAALEGRGRGPATLAAGVLLALLGGLAYMALRQASEAEPPPPRPVPVIVSPPTAGAWIVAPMPGPEPTPEVPKAPPVVAAIQSKERAPSRPADMPYRFIGKLPSGAETSIVLFGRGRVVNLHGPGPLDDEYVVEAVFDEYLVLRHVPTGVGKFLQLTQRLQVPEPPREPEDSPRD
jgi:hypothetical protein